MSQSPHQNELLCVKLQLTNRPLHFQLQCFLGLGGWFSAPFEPFRGLWGTASQDSELQDSPWRGLEVKGSLAEHGCVAGLAHLEAIPNLGGFTILGGALLGTLL